ncbi:MAG: dockerin type I repeat-containing protein, partial [Clostridia bacterium]|nr:dockerin type I repeat-containing protein [Clostridia bacterium]
TFKIPVFYLISATAPKLPAKSDKVNNYYFTKISVSGLSPTFSMYTKSYKLSVSGNTTITYTVPDKASFASAATVSLKAGTNTVTMKVKSETGYTNDYTVTVTASNACTLTFKDANAVVDGGTTPTVTQKLGDPNGDGVIDVVDLAAVKLHLLKKRLLTGDALKMADVNKDGIVDVVDLAAIKLHLLKKRLITG